ncbi:MAG: MFS transporter [Chloroflexi bacterium]|nr:MFS transporter [Chloroflexota bacterium]
MTATLTRQAPSVLRRLTAILFAGQSTASLAMTATITIGSIAASQLTGTSAFAGVPTTLYVLGAALGAYPAGKLMDRCGRRTGLTLGFLLGALGASAGGLAMLGVMPLLLFMAYGVMGASRGALDQGRFAAADMVTPEHRARAVGWVVLGGAVGGLGGPLVVSPASRLATQFGFDALVGPFLAGALMLLLGCAVTWLFLRPDPRDIGRALATMTTEAKGDEPPARTFLQALQSPHVRTAVAAMMLGQVVMVAVMVMTPLQMTEHLNHTLDDVSLVIAAHVTGMYATSVVTGRIADRLGHARTILIGAVLLILACVLAPFSTEMPRLALALFVLGAGWNFCFVAGSSLLTDSIRINERGRMQGANDLLVGLVAAAGSLSSGLVFETIGYAGIALAGITLAVGLFVYILWRVRLAPSPSPSNL